jgi:hypothetical protein
MFVSPLIVAVSRQKIVGSAMLGTGDVAIIYHISTTGETGGWRVRVTRHRSREGSSKIPETRRRGRAGTAHGCTPSSNY